MKLQKTRLGFTLIELLVVITIIGILATGAVSVYTSQIQKARDSTRLTDITAVKAGIEQFYQDYAQYPNSNNAADTFQFDLVKTYTPKLPQDPKSGNSRTNAAFDYIYTVGQDANAIDGQDYEVSSTFENQGNITNKAMGDGGNDDARIEIGVDLATNATDVTSAIASNLASLTCVAQNGQAVACSDSGTRLLIRKQ